MVASNPKSALFLLLASSSLTSAQQQKPLLDQARSLAASGASRFNIPLPSAFAPPPPSAGERVQNAADSVKSGAESVKKGAADSVKGAADAAQSVTEDVAAAAAAAAAADASDLGGVESLTWDGWRDLLTHSREKKEDEIWMVYVTGNRTCRGHCIGLDKAWTVSDMLSFTGRPPGRYHSPATSS